MATTFRLTAILAGLAMTAGCAGVGVGTGGSGSRGTSVTRTHLGGVATRGEVSVEPRFEIQAAGGVYQPGFGASVANELRALGFAPAATPAASEFVATVDVATGTQTALYARVPGVGATPAAPTADAAQLAVQLKRRSDGSIVWEGRALRASRAGQAPSDSTVRSLARALFRDFPGETGRTVIVN